MVHIFSIYTPDLKQKYIIIDFRMMKTNVSHTFFRRRAARGRRTLTFAVNSVGVQPASGLKGGGDILLPRATPLQGLHGVIYVHPLSGTGSVALKITHNS